jgi:hypothetical protein
VCGCVCGWGERLAEELTCVVEVLEFSVKDRESIIYDSSNGELEIGI